MGRSQLHYFRLLLCYSSVSLFSHSANPAIRSHTPFFVFGYAKQALTLTERHSTVVLSRDIKEFYGTCKVVNIDLVSQAR